MSREPTALLLAAFVVTFVLTRGYTRVARVRGWGSGSVGGVHLHYIVVGIVLVLLSGLVAEMASRLWGRSESDRTRRHTRPSLIAIRPLSPGERFSKGRAARQIAFS